MGITLTNDNYFSKEADEHFMSVSQYKSFAGSIGMDGCEARAMALLEGRWEQKVTTPMMVGSYVDAYYEGTLDKFKAEHPEIFTNRGDLRADYVQADKIIKRSEEDTMFQGFMAGDKQVIMTGKLFGTEWKIKMDSYVENEFICDLKVVDKVFEDDANEPRTYWVRKYGYVDWIKYWGYDIQGAIYQEIVYQNTGKRLPFFIAALDKQKERETGMAVFHLDEQCLRDALSAVEYNLPRILDVKARLAEPDRCEMCDYCRRTKVLDKVIEIHPNVQRDEGKGKG